MLAMRSSDSGIDKVVKFFATAFNSLCKDIAFLRGLFGPAPRCEKGYGTIAQVGKCRLGLGFDLC